MPNLRSAINDFLAWHERDRRQRKGEYSNSTRDAYERALRELAEALGDNRDVNTITREEVEAHLSKVMGRGLGASSHNQKLSAFRSFWKWLNREYDIADVAYNIRLAVGDKEETPVALPHQVQAILSQIGPKVSDAVSLRDWVMIELISIIGLSAAEAHALDTDSVRIEPPTEGIGHEVLILDIRGRRNKTRKIRVALIGERLLRFGVYLRAYLDMRNDASFWLRYPESEVALFLSATTKKRITQRSILRCFKMYAARAGFPELTLRSLRRGAARNMLASGADELTIARILGHSLPSITRTMDLDAVIEKERGTRNSVAEDDIRPEPVEGREPSDRGDEREYGEIDLDESVGPGDDEWNNESEDDVIDLDYLTEP